MPLQTLTSLGGPLFVKAALCAFCGSPSVCLCDWPVEKQELRYAESLRAGDDIEFLGSRRKLIRVEETYGDFAIELTWTFKGDRQRPYAVGRTHPIYVFIEGAATCDTPACDLHRRNVGDGRDYCREHWDAWEKAA